MIESIEEVLPPVPQQARRGSVTVTATRAAKSTLPSAKKSLSIKRVFSDAKTKQATGQWWVRTFIGYYSPVLSLKSKP